MTQSGVAETAAEQAKQVAGETTRQARNLIEEGKGQVAEQARQGQQKAAGSLHTLADQLEEMSRRPDNDGIASDVARQAAERARDVASWLEQHELGDLLTEVRTFARRRPGMFLAGAALAGVLAGRLTRGVVAAKSDEDADAAPDRGMSDAPVPPPVTGYSVPPAPTPPGGPVTR
jgi:hypothetical protein